MELTISNNFGNEINFISQSQVNKLIIFQTYNFQNFSQSKKCNLNSYSLAIIDFPCQVIGCNKIFKGRGNLKVHMRSHFKDKPFKCEFLHCERSFSTKGNLKAHTFIHKNYKPFRCSFVNCPKRYINECRLKVHERTHVI